MTRSRHQVVAALIRTVSIGTALICTAVLAGGCATATPDVAVATTTTTTPPTTAAPSPLPAGCDDVEDLADTASYSPKLTDGGTVAAIRQAGVLRVGVSDDTLLFGYRDPATDRLEGFDIELLRLVSKSIFGAATGDERLRFVVMAYSDRLPALEEGRVDLVAHTMTINCTRWARIGFSATYLDAGQRLLVRADSNVDALEGLGTNDRLCVTAGSTSSDNSSGLAVKVVTVPDITDCLVKFQRGEVSAIRSDDTVLAGFAAQDPGARVVGPRLSREPYGIGAKAGSVDLVRHVNAVIEQAFADGTWQLIYDQNLAPTLGAATVPARVYDRPVP